MALEPKASSSIDQSPGQATSITETRSTPEPALSPAGPGEVEKSEKKVFQAFNIKPLRQKLSSPADLDELQRRRAEQEAEGDAPRVGEMILRFFLRSHNLFHKYTEA